MYIYLYHPVSLRNTFVTSSCIASKSLPRTKCYSLIEIFPSRHPSLAKLTPCCRAPPKQIFTRSRARRRASYVREEGGGQGVWEFITLRSIVHDVGVRQHAVDISKNIYDPPSFSESSVICRGSRQNCLSIVPLRPLVKVTTYTPSPSRHRPPFPGN